MLIRLLKNEWTYYQKLSERSKLLILSFGLWSVAQPILYLFVNAYIWRTTASVITVSLYNLGFVIALPFGFFINGKLLQKLHITQTYFIGLFVSVSSAASVIFFHSTSWQHLLAYGLVYGLGGGIYWASRNYLTFQETNSDTRNYFFSISSVVSSIINIFITFSIGWLIAFADISKLYSPFMAYVCVTILALISVFFAGSILLKSGFETPIVKKIWQPFISKRWNIVRFGNLAIGILESISFGIICTLLILYFLGEEGVLGTISAIVSIFTILLYYLYGRLAKQHHRGIIFLSALLVSLLLATLLFFNNDKFIILAYVLLAGLPISFYFLTTNPWIFDVMDKELSEHPHEKYLLIFDREIFLNIGRVIGLAIIILLVFKFSEELTLRVSPLLLTIMQLITFVFIWKKIDWEVT